LEILSSQEEFTRFGFITLGVSYGYVIDEGFNKICPQYPRYGDTSTAEFSAPALEKALAAIVKNDIQSAVRKLLEKVNIKVVILTFLADGDMLQ
jgi:hypothetical protein